jgi:hypothetical protein
MKSSSSRFSCAVALALAFVNANAAPGYTNELLWIDDQIQSGEEIGYGLAIKKRSEYISLSEIF